MIHVEMITASLDPVRDHDGLRTAAVVFAYLAALSIAAVLAVIAYAELVTLFGDPQ